MTNNEISLAEATFEQLAGEIHSRARDFLMVVQAEDGSHGTVSHVFYGHMYGSLGLAKFCEALLLNKMLSADEDHSDSDHLE